MTCGEHVVSSLHAHAFWFLLFRAAWLVPEDLARLLEPVAPACRTLAMREACDGRWVPTIARTVFAKSTCIPFTCQVLLTCEIEKCDS